MGIIIHFPIDVCDDETKASWFWQSCWSFCLLMQCVLFFFCVKTHEFGLHCCCSHRSLASCIVTCEWGVEAWGNWKIKIKMTSQVAIACYIYISFVLRFIRSPVKYRSCFRWYSCLCLLLRYMITGNATGFCMCRFMRVGVKTCIV